MIGLYSRHKEIQHLLACAKSFIYMMNNRGLNIEPCGTHVVIDNILNLILLISVYCFLRSCRLS